MTQYTPKFLTQYQALAAPLGDHVIHAVEQTGGQGCVVEQFEDPVQPVLMVMAVGEAQVAKLLALLTEPQQKEGI